MAQHRQSAVLTSARMSVLWLALGVGGLSSCERPRPTEPPPTAANTESQATILGVQFTARPEEGNFVELARRAPGTAGFYFDARGGLVVRVKSSVAGNEGARSAVHALIALGRIDPPDRGAVIGPVKVEHADYSFAELARWRDIAFDHALLAIRGVTSLDLDEVRNRVALGIDPSTFDATRRAVVATHYESVSRSCP